MAFGLSEEDIDNIFSFHPPKNEDVAAAHEQVREGCRELAQDLKALCPDSPEQTTAIRKLQEAMMYANAAIALHS